MPRTGSRPRVVVPIVAFLALAAACSNAATDRELARISSRLDSFAVTLTAVTTALSRGSGPTGPTSVTVGAQGAASLGLAPLQSQSLNSPTISAPSAHGTPPKHSTSSSASTSSLARCAM